MQINGFSDTLMVAVVGMLVVFLGLMILIALIKVMGMLTGNTGKKEAPVKAAPAAEPVAAPVEAAPVAATGVVPSLITADTKIQQTRIDDETVAVLIAAVKAIRGEGYPFKVKRIVRANPMVVPSRLKPDDKIRPAKIDDETIAVINAALTALRGEEYPFRIRRIVRVGKA